MACVIRILNLVLFSSFYEIATTLSLVSICSERTDVNTGKVNMK